MSEEARGPVFRVRVRGTTPRRRDLDRSVAPTQDSDHRETQALASATRKQSRADLRIPFRLRIRDDREIYGHLIDFGIGGFSLAASLPLHAGFPLELQCNFADTCYLELSGQVAYCISDEDSGRRCFRIGIRLCGTRQWHQQILKSVIEELKANHSTQERSLLCLLVSKDALALEAAEALADEEYQGAQGKSPLRTRPISRTVRTRRVVITGIGALAPNGIGREAFWDALAQGRNCVDRITFFDPSVVPSQIAAEIKDFDPYAIIPHKEVKRMGRSAQLGIGAAQLAVEDSLIKITQDLKSRIGVILGTGTGGVEYAESDYDAFFHGGADKIRPYAAIAAFPGALSSEISRALGLTGPSLTISTGCTASTDACGLAFNTIRYGMADILITGGSEACITPGILGAFCKAGAPCTTSNAEPKKASRPFNKDRDGFVLGEGAWVFVIEELDHALRRGAKIYAEVAGHAATCDAYHMSRPLPSGEFTIKAMATALLDATISPHEVDYVSAYGNSTKINDSYETMVLKHIFGDHALKLMVSSIKSMIGHSIGSCGAGALAATLMAIDKGIVPPTINYALPDPDCDLDYVANVARQAEVRVAAINTLAFGSKNSVLIIKKFDPHD